MDISQFDQAMSGSIGLEVSGAKQGGGSCLLLEAGEISVERLEGRSGKIHEFCRGRFGFMLEWDWRVERHRSIEFGSASSDRKLSNRIASLVGEKIASVSLVGEVPELRITFESGRRVLTFMTVESQPAWVVFLDQHESWIYVQRGCLYRSARQ